MIERTDCREYGAIHQLYGILLMFKEFPHYTAWTDTMQDELGYAGLIGYHSNTDTAPVHELIVIAARFPAETDAEIYAEIMLAHIKDITATGTLIFADDVTI